MKNQHVFPAIILIGFGAYFFLQQSAVSFLQPFHTWPTLLIIVGIAFLFQGYGANEYNAILPGIILTGFGLHFHVVHRLEIWPDHIGTFILIIALGFLLRNQKTGTGLFQGILFLMIAALLLFSNKVIEWVGLFGISITAAWKFWPVLLIIAGLFLLIKKK